MAMDRLIDTSCMALQENSLVTAQSIKDGHNACSKWVSRQITAAYDEHAIIIESLREELDAAKIREKALILEFTDRFRKMQLSAPGTNGAFDELCTSHTYASDIPNDSDEDIGYDEDDEMPMDEKAEASRNGDIESKPRLKERRLLEKFKEQTYREMENMRQENESKILTIERALKEKVEEIDCLKKQQKNQFFENCRSRSCSPGPPIAPTPSNRHSRNPSDENSPARSLNNSIPYSYPARKMTQMTRHPRTWERSITPINRIKAGISTQNMESSEIVSPPPSPRYSSANPTNNLRVAHSSRYQDGDTIEGNYDSLNSPTKIHTKWGLEASHITTDGSFIDNDAATLRNTPAKKTQHQEEGQHHETYKMETMEKLLTAIDIHILRKKTADGHPLRITEEELKFIEKIKSIINSSQKKQKHKITNLKKNLEGTTKDSAKLCEDLKEREEYIKELEKQLNSANESLRNTTDLESMLRMLGGDHQKEIELENVNLKQKLIEAEQARDTLLQQKDDLDDYNSDQSVRAFERVLEDVTTEKNETVGKLTAQIDQLKNENSRLNIQLDDSPNDASNLNCNPDGCHMELLELREQSKRTAHLEEELSKVKHELKEAKSQKEESLLSLQKLKEKTRNMEEKLDHFSNEDKSLSDLNEKEILTDTKRGEESDTTDRSSIPISDTSQIKLDKINEEDEQKNSTTINENNATLEITLAKKRVCELEKLVVDLRKQIEDKNVNCAELSFQIESHQKSINTLENDKATIELDLRNCTKRNEYSERKMRDSTHQMNDFKKQLAMAAEALKTTKAVHIREQKLEDELSELRSLLDKTMKGKTELQSEVKAKSEAMAKLKKQHEQYLEELQIEVSRLVQEKTLLEQRSKVTNEKRDYANDILLLQEKLRNTSRCNQVIRKNLREEQLLHDKLRLVSDQSSKEIIDLINRLSASASSSLCILESATSPTSVACHGNFDYDSSKITRGKGSTRTHILEENLKLLRVENEQIREVIGERDQELVFLNTEMNRINEEYVINKDLLTKKEQELRVLKESLNDTSICYISGDDSDSDDENSIAHESAAIVIHAPMVACENSYDKEMCANLINAKEEAEKRAKSNGESLANAKLIIASLEESNKKMTEDLRSRLNDSNAALVSILEQSQKHERESGELRNEIDKLKSEKNNNAGELRNEKEKLSEIGNDPTMKACDGVDDNDENEI